jgi:hypothetical protein
MTKLKLPCIVGAIALALPDTMPLGLAQPVQDFYRITDSVSRNRMEYHRLDVPKGKATVLADLKGPGKVTYFYITDATQVHWYPGLVLKVFWDDESEPSVQAPLADFFGAIGGKTIDYQSAPMQINHAWYLANPVRFQHSLKVQIQNQHDNGTPTTTDADDYTSLAFWFQEEPHHTFTLQPFSERTAPTRAGGRQ